MKKALLSLSLLLSSLAFSQFVSTPTTALGSSGMTVKLLQETNLVRITVTGPSTSYLAIGFNTTSMSAPADAFIYNSTANRDYLISGYVAPTADTNQDWTEVSNTVSGTTRTVVYTRLKNTGEAGDQVFTGTTGSLNIIYARGGNMDLAYHGGTNRGTAIVQFSNVLSTDEVEMQSNVSFAPNPSNDEIIFANATKIDSIQIFDLSGKLLLNQKMTDKKVNIQSLQKGNYLLFIQLKNDTAFSKKLIKN